MSVKDKRCGTCKYYDSNDPNSVYGDCVYLLHIKPKLPRWVETEVSMVNVNLCNCPCWKEKS